jgi:hypothetical protein
MPRQSVLWSGKYVDVAASQTGALITTQTGGATGGVGDYIDGILIVPETTAAGTIALLDGTTSKNIFVTGTLSDLKPHWIPIRARAVNSGGWSITTGANVHVKVCGNF